MDAVKPPATPNSPAQSTPQAPDITAAVLPTAPPSTDPGAASLVPRDPVSVGLGTPEKSYAVLAQRVLDRLAEMLRAELPEGLRDLAPEDHTPDRTADRIFDGVMGLFEAFKAQNPELEGEELRRAFADTVGKGVTEGYEEAKGILEAAGAFELPGIEDGIAKTIELVHEKLERFVRGSDSADDSSQQSSDDGTGSGATGSSDASTSSSDQRVSETA